MTRVAAVDCGTNSLRLLIADVEEHTLVDVVRRMEIVRLGQGVDATGRLAPEALRRTFNVLADYARAIKDSAVERVRMVATSATRDAANREEFVDGVVSVLGVTPEVVTGLEEAELSFLGATRELVDQFPSPYLVVDIGGGSTEVVLGTTSVEAARSVDVGCVRLTERYLRDDPPAAAGIAAAVDDIEAALDTIRASVAVDSARTLVGLAGSVTTVTALALALDHYDPTRVHHARITRSLVEDVTSKLLGMTRAERATLPVLHPGRVDVIGAGALVLATIMRCYDIADMVASEHDILDGIAWSQA